MDRAGANDNEESAILVAALDNLDGLIATLENSFSRLWGLGNLALQKVWGCEGVVATNSPVFGVGGVAN